MIQAAFKRELYNPSKNQNETCQIIVKFENNRYQAEILCFVPGEGYGHTTRKETPVFDTSMELKDYLKHVFQPEPPAMSAE